MIISIISITMIIVFIDHFRLIPPFLFDFLFFPQTFNSIKNSLWKRKILNLSLLCSFSIFLHLGSFIQSCEDHTHTRTHTHDRSGSKARYRLMIYSVRKLLFTSYVFESLGTCESVSFRRKTLSLSQRIEERKSEKSNLHFCSFKTDQHTHTRHTKHLGETRQLTNLFFYG